MPNWIDLVISGFILASVLYSLFRGMIREVFSIVALVAGYFCASRLYSTAAPQLESLIGQKLVSQILSFVLLYFAAAFVVILFGKLMVKLLWSSHEISVMDRFLGGVIGLVKGAFVVSLLLIPIGFIPAIRNDISSRSMLAPYFLEGSKFLTQRIHQNAGVSSLTSQNGTPLVVQDPLKGAIQTKLNQWVDQGRRKNSPNRPQAASSPSPTQPSTHETVSPPEPGKDQTHREEDQITPEDQSKMNELLDNLLSPEKSDP